MNSFTKLLIGGVGTMMACAFLGGPASATPITDLGAGGGTIVVGDKTFSDFTCKITATTGNPLTCGQIDVSGLNDGGNLGIEFQAAFIVIGSFPLEDVLLSYVVTVNDPSQLIKDVEMEFNGEVSDVAAAITKVTETVFGGDVCSGGSVAQIVVTNPPPLTNQKASADIAPPQSQVCVKKDILLAAFTIDASGSISFIDQRFSQTKVPEPATLALLGMGLLGLGVMNRRRRVS